MVKVGGGSQTAEQRKLSTDQRIGAEKPPTGPTANPDAPRESRQSLNRQGQQAETTSDRKPLTQPGNPHSL